MRRNGDMIDTSLGERFCSIVILANKQGFHLNGHSISCEWKIKLSTIENWTEVMECDDNLPLIFIFCFPFDLRANFEIEAKLAFFSSFFLASKFPRIDFYALIYATARVGNLQETMETRVKRISRIGSEKKWTLLSKSSDQKCILWMRITYANYAKAIFAKHGTWMWIWIGWKRMNSMSITLHILVAWLTMNSEFELNFLRRRRGKTRLQ